MEKIIEINKCCGCHSCVNKCPKGAITMQERNNGFKYPVIDQSKCVDCGLCKKSCPVLNKNNNKSDYAVSYACYNKNMQERLNSSSGGIFILLAREILNRGGVVFGASFDKEFNVIHIPVEKEEDIYKLMGSKYLQSIIGDSYKMVKKYLDDDKYVFFTGTPCQIEGLKSFLGREYDRLYTQDIICHGVPSPKVWQKYIKYQQNKNKEKIRNVQLRNKDLGWSLFQTKIFFETKTYSENFTNDLYMKAFLNNLCLRESCYNCSFKKKKRIADITLADYWGINKEHPNMNDNKGTSLVVVHSEKGKELFDSIIDKVKYEKTTLAAAIKYNSAMIESVKHSINENEFFDNLDNFTFDELVNKFIPELPIYKKLINKIKKFIKKNIK